MRKPPWTFKARVTINPTRWEPSIFYKILPKFPAEPALHFFLPYKILQSEQLKTKKAITLSVTANITTQKLKINS
jgi:hypothetical protein